DCAAPMIVKRLVVVGSNVAAREYLLQVPEEFRIDGHHIFKMPMFRAILDHQDLAVMLYYLRLELSDFLIAKDIYRQLAIENLVPNLGHTLRAKRISRSWPAQRRFRLLIGFQQRLLRPSGYESWILSDLVYSFEHGPHSGRNISQAFLSVFDRFPHIYIGS